MDQRFYTNVLPGNRLACMLSSPIRQAMHASTDMLKFHWDTWDAVQLSFTGLLTPEPTAC